MTRTFKIYFLSNFEIYNTVPLIIITMFIVHPHDLFLKIHCHIIKPNYYFPDLLVFHIFTHLFISLFYFKINPFCSHLFDFPHHLLFLCFLIFIFSLFLLILVVNFLPQIDFSLATDSWSCKSENLNLTQSTARSIGYTPYLVPLKQSLPARETWGVRRSMCAQASAAVLSSEFTL